MREVYIFGHRNPDTDSVASAIALSYLKNKLGMNTIPVILSSINRETKYALNYFGIKEPRFLNDVKLKVKDLDYYHNIMVKLDTSIFDAYNEMSLSSISKIPIVDKYKKVIGIIGMRDIAMHAINGNIFKLETTYNNVIKVMEGTKITKYENIIKGNIIVKEYNNKLMLKHNDILVTKEMNLTSAIKHKVNLIIVTDNAKVSDNDINLAKNNKVNIIGTSFNYLDVIKKLSYCNNVSTILTTKDVYTIKENTEITSFSSLASKVGYTYYPITDSYDRCLGIIKYADVGFHHKKQVILVDHNSYNQSAIGIEEADILEIIDHHNISNIGTNNPINFRNMPLGSTCTIVYLMYKENNIKITPKMAGIMLSGILSDTLILNSPTTTNYDKEAVNNLSKICNIDYQKYGFDMISYGSKLTGMTKEEIIYNDFKRYPTSSGVIGLGQIYTTDNSDIEKEKQDYIDILNNIAKINEYKFVILFVTDFIKNGTYIYYSNNAKEILEKSFNKEIEEGIYIPGAVSRKMQLLPSILEIMD